MLSYEIRAAVPGDEDLLFEVAKHLNTVNLPADRKAIASLVKTSKKSFTQAIKDPTRREYVFVLVDRVSQAIVGTSMIVGQLGRRDAPYIYLDVLNEERYSATLDKHFKHTTLSIAYSYDGPTELGGLIVLPQHRKIASHLGTLISYVRFLYIKMHRANFQDELLAELLPPLGPDGVSHLWNALGRNFTGLTYAEADRLSKRNKEFIRTLFPSGMISASLFDPLAREVIGKVGPQTRGVEKMLRRVGFRYAKRVDPFDGGPHFTAPTDEVTAVDHTRHDALGEPLNAEAPPTTHGMVAVESATPPYFRALETAWQYDVAGNLQIEPSVHDALSLKPGDQVWFLPIALTQPAKP